MRFLILAMLLNACGPGFHDDFDCHVDGWTIRQEFGQSRSCDYYQSVLGQGWNLLVTRGWVRGEDRPLFEAVPMRVHSEDLFTCGGNLVVGCYHPATFLEDVYIDVESSMGSIVHEWLHHHQALRGVSAHDNYEHVGWSTNGRLLTDTKIIRPDSAEAAVGLQPYYSTSWYGAGVNFLFEMNKQYEQSLGLAQVEPDRVSHLMGLSGDVR